MFDPQTAQIRFGFGLSESSKPKLSIRDLLKEVGQLDPVEQSFASIDTKTVLKLAKTQGDNNKARRKSVSGSEAEGDRLSDQIRDTRLENLRSVVARAVLSNNGFRERLVSFWADHFTVSARNRILQIGIFAMLDQAIRPNISGRFANLLKAADMHPAMLLYLDQQGSFGPNSQIGKRRKKGLNENLARELLELHTLGVGGGYAQKDVRQLAELLTGLRHSQEGQHFVAKVAEPGSETVLGKSYGGGSESQAHIEAFMDDISVHPQTARHLARKLVIHFITPDPDPQLIEDMAAEYLSRDGDLMAFYEVMLSHPSAWDTVPRKVKQPFDYVISGMRAMGVDQTRLSKMKQQALGRQVVAPMRLMGQTMFRPNGPNGWPEEEAAWITPVNLSGRVQWSMEMASWYGKRVYPRALVDRALGQFASDGLRFAVSRSETRREGIALILASPEFNRR